MKVRALASLSGPMSRRAADDVFVVDAQLGEELVARKVAEEVVAEPDTVAEALAAKPGKVKAAAKE